MEMVMVMGYGADRVCICMTDVMAVSSISGTAVSVSS